MLTCSPWWMCALWVGLERQNPCVMSCEPPLSLPSQLLPPSLLFLQKTERQVLYSLLAMRWHHPVFHHILSIGHNTLYAALCWKQPAVLSLSHGAIQSCPLTPYAHIKGAWDKNVHTFGGNTISQMTNLSYLNPHLTIRRKAHLIALHSDLLLPLFIPHKQA